MKQRRQVLGGHRRKGSTFYPPFLSQSSELGIGLVSVEWRRNILPELIWLAPLVHDHGFQKACTLASALSNAAGQAGNWSTFPHIGAVSSFAKLTPEQRSHVRRQMQAAGLLNDLRKSVDPLIRLYPKCPLGFLLGNEKPAVKKQEAMTYMAPLLEECLFRGECLPTIVQGVYYAMGLASGRMLFNEGMTPPLPQDLEGYPESESAQRAAGFIRCIVGQFDAMKVESFWPEYFWQSGNNIGKCQIREESGTSIGAVSQAFMFYHLECFRLYSEESGSIWELCERKRTFNLYNQGRDEVLYGLAARIYRLGIQIASFIPNWVEDIGQVYVRMAVESYIYWVWFKHHALEADFAKFYEHGLGQQKLYSEHISSLLASQGLSKKEIDEGNAGLEFLKHHRLPEFVPVNIGNAVGKDLRSIAKEAGLSDLYSLVYGPTSSMVHGMYDTLEQYYLRRCLNPFHCLHRVPFYWTKNSISEYGPENSLILTDWVLAEMLTDVGEVPPIPMPGERFFMRLQDEKASDDFLEHPEHGPKVAKNEEFVSGLRKGMMKQTKKSSPIEGDEVSR
jgi:hypothetical protein